MNKIAYQFRNVRATMRKPKTNEESRNKGKDSNSFPGDKGSYVPDSSKNWGALLQGALRRELEDVPKDWKTVRDISDEIGKSLSHTYALVARRLHQKKLERRVFMVETINGRVYPSPYYREIK